MREPRMWWAGDEKGWIIDTEQPLSMREVQRCVDYTATVQAQRFLNLISGDKRSECARTIQALKAGRVQQNIIGVGDKVLYDAYKKENKIFVMGNNRG